ncbi:hypothetical protein KAR91_51210, partial [Candidatus Pacearchaeota archaeon]|nr:hypothetical protein [Candidatus Pacearchaeota archaeon]
METLAMANLLGEINQKVMFNLFFGCRESRGMKSRFGIIPILHGGQASNRKHNIKLTGGLPSSAAGLN